MQNVTQKKTACPRDCPDACGLIVTIDNGRVVRLQGDPDHPITQGFICGRTTRYTERQNSSERLTRPLLRRSKSANFEAISWDNAFDVITERMLRYRQESGAESILQYRCGGSLGIMKHVGDYFFERFGPVTVKRGDVCAGAGNAAQQMDFGDCDSSDVLDFQNSKTIFLWGKNVFVSSIHLIPELKAARANGTNVVLIDPIHHQTTSIADYYVQPRPGSDSAIAMGIARWLFENNAVDTTITDYCDNVEKFRELTYTKTVEDWASVADLSAGELTTLARMYASGPTCSMIGWGLQRRRHGAATIRTIDALAAVSGNIGISGGGSSFYFVRRDAFDLSFSDPDAAPRTITEPMLGSEILSAIEPPIRMAWIWAANPVAMLPDSVTVAKALRTREFTVVVDPFLTDTARCADLVLPTTTFLEEDDLIGSYGHHYLAEVNPVVVPPEGVLSDHEIFRELSRRMGISDDFDLNASVWKQRLLSKLNGAGVTMNDFRKGSVRNPFASNVLFADRKFNTSTGNINLIHELHSDMTKIPMERQLKLSALSTGKSQASQWPAETQIGPAIAVVHPLSVPDFSDGDEVTLTTERAHIQVRLHFDDRQRQDVILMEKGGWYSSGRSANALIAGEVTDDGECAVYYDTPAAVSQSFP
ncbi:MAG: molybdopterin-dependent oxidoreductase [Fuerstiella sp.]|nr:molybdopterin-dependent oxidoreductase [Fuerstiella sp.]